MNVISFNIKSDCYRKLNTGRTQSIFFTPYNDKTLWLNFIHHKKLCVIERYIANDRHIITVNGRFLARYLHRVRIIFNKDATCSVVSCI